MASRAISPGAPVEALLSIIPSLPRPALDHLIERMIDRLDQMDGDPDLEETDREPDTRRLPRPTYETDQRRHIGHGWRHE
jgi:hypothetical protein